MRRRTFRQPKSAAKKTMAFILAVAMVFSNFGTLRVHASEGEGVEEQSQGGAPAAEGTQGEAPAAEGTQGGAPATEGTQGEAPAAEGTQGEAPAAEGTQGEAPAGETPVGEGTQGEAPAAEGTQGGAPAPATEGVQSGAPAEGGAPVGEDTQSGSPAGEVNQGAAPAAEVTVCKVSFMGKNPADGAVTLLREDSVNAGTAVQGAPAAPEYDGYQFTGWTDGLGNLYTSAQLTALQVTGDTVYTAAYAVLGKFSVEVRFVYGSKDGAAVQAPAVYEVVQGKMLTTTVALPVKEGYQYSCDEGILDPENNKLTIENVASEKIFYVVYTGGGREYTVTHRFQAVDGTYPKADEEIENLNGALGSETQAASKVRDGFTAGEVNNVTIAEKGAINVNINYTRNSYVLSFDTDGGSYVASETYVFGDSIKLPKEPTKLGYTFDGWTFTVTDTSDKIAEPATMPAQNLTAKANWISKESASYQIIYWQQKATDKPDTADADKAYDFYTSETKQAKVGSTPNINGKAKEQAHFLYNSANTTAANDGVKVTADGKTVYNVYYDREVINIVFHTSSWSLWTGTTWSEFQRLTGLYGSTFAQNNVTWPTIKDEAWYEAKSGGIRQTFMEAFILPASAGNSTVYKLYSQSAGGNVKIQHYTENIDGTWTKADAVDAKYGNTFNFSNKYTGFVVSGYADDSNATAITNAVSAGGKAYVELKGMAVFHKRNSYNLTFSNIAKPEQVALKYEQPLKDAKQPEGAALTAPAGIDADYTFAGWYEDEACQKPVDFETLMPASNKQIFAKWEVPSYTLTFKLNDDSDATVSVKDYPKYEAISQDKYPADPTRTGYNFTGWYTDTAATKAFIAGTGLTQDITLYAGWKPISNVYNWTIKCVDEEENALTPVAGSVLTGSAKAGTVVSVKAPEVEGYYALLTSKNVTMNLDEEVVFTYNKAATWEYKVVYKVVYADGAEEVISEDTPVSTQKQQVSVSYKTFAGYRLNDAYQKTATQTAGGVTEVVFLYTPDAANIAVHGVKHIYDGALYSVSVTGVATGDVISYNGTDSNLAYKDAGMYPVAVSVSRNGHEIFTGSATVEITKRTVVMISDSASKQYDGTPLTAKKVSESGDGFASGEGAIYNVTGIQETPGSSNNTFTYQLTAATKADNYHISTDEGTLTVTNRDAKYEVTVQAKSLKKTYNGLPHTAKGVSLEGATGLSIKIGSETYTVSGLSAERTEKDAGEYAVNVTGTAKVVDSKGRDVTSQFTVNTKPGTLTINKKKITFTSPSAEKVFDGTPLTAWGVKRAGSPATGDEIGYDIRMTSITYPGSIPNDFEVTFKNGTNPNNYEVTKNIGTLTVHPRTAKYEIEVQANSGNFIYDKAEHSVSGFVTDTFVVDGRTYTVSGLTAEMKQTDAGVYMVSVEGTPVVKDAADYDVSSQFKVTVKTGTLTIAPRPITITSATAEKTYDGDPLVNKTVKATYTGDETKDAFVGTDGSYYSVTGMRTLPGVSNNSFTYTLTRGTKASNYDITKVEGTLTVKSRDAKYVINVTANSDGDEYKGVEQSVSGWQIETTGDVTAAADSTFTVAGKTYTLSGLTAGATGTDAGTYPANITGTPVITDAAGNIVTDEFTVNTTPGALMVTPRPISITSLSAEKEFDGQPLKKEEVTLRHTEAITRPVFVGGDSITITYTGEQTAVGSSDNTFTYTFNPGTKAGNYTITTATGKLTVKDRTAKYAVTVQAASAVKEYNGQTQSVNGWSVVTAGDAVQAGAASFTVNGVVYQITGLTASASGKDVAGSPYAAEVTGTPVITDPAGSDVTAQFALTRADGALTITPKDVYMASYSDVKEYDGNPLTNHGVDDLGFVDGEGATYDVTGTITTPGIATNTFTYTANAGTDLNNYTVTKMEGKLEVLNRNAKYEISVEANSKSVKYDGTQQTADGFKTLHFTVNGNEFTVEGLTANAGAVDAGTYLVTVKGTAVVRDAAGNDVTNQFAVKTIDGSLTIDKRNVTLKSGDAKKVYDGMPLTKHEVTVIAGDGFADGESLEYNITGEITLPGTTRNEFTYAPKARAVMNLNNYNITVQYGVLEVTDRPADDLLQIVVNANDGIFTYDGQEHTVTGLKETQFTVMGREYTVEGLTVSETQKNVSDTPYIVYVEGTAKVLDAEGNDVTKQFSVSRNTGRLEILKRKVTLTSATDEKEYDGEYLTNDNVTVDGEGFADGEGAAFNVTGRQKLVGTSNNFFTYTLNANTLATNYEITENLGTLTVKEAGAVHEVTVTAGVGEVLYDGEEHGVTDMTGDTFEFGGHTYRVTGLESTDTWTDAGEYTVNLTGTPVILDEEGDEVSDVFAVRVEPGKLIINKREVTLTSATDSKVDDGTPLTNDEVTISGDGFATDEGVILTVTGSQSGPGTSANTFTYIWQDNTLEDNYVITTAEGVLTVTAAPVGGGDGTDPTPGTPVEIPDDPTPLAEAPLPPPVDGAAVLGTRRTTADDSLRGQVKGSRRGQTGEESQAQGVMVMALAGIGALALALAGKKKKNEEE